MEQDILAKQYVDCMCLFTSDGQMIPKSIIWNDGRTFDITNVLDIRRSVSLKAGGAGIRYTVIIYGKKKQLFFEDLKFGSCVGGMWFIEVDK